MSRRGTDSLLYKNPCVWVGGGHGGVDRMRTNDEQDKHTVLGSDVAEGGIALETAVKGATDAERGVGFLELATMADFGWHW